MDKLDQAQQDMNRAHEETNKWVEEYKQSLKKPRLEQPGKRMPRRPKIAIVILLGFWVVFFCFLYHLARG